MELQIPNPNNLTWKTLLIILAVIATVGSVIYTLANDSTTKLQNDEIKQLKHERDSIITFNINESGMLIINFNKKVDSLKTTIKLYETKDSANHYYYEKEKNKVSHYTPAVRNRVLDSIFEFNGIGSRHSL